MEFDSDFRIEIEKLSYREAKPYLRFLGRQRFEWKVSSIICALLSGICVLLRLEDDASFWHSESQSSIGTMRRIDRQANIVKGMFEL